MRKPDPAIATAIRLMADDAALNGADANDSTGYVRDLVAQNGLGFNAWLCVCCELADRSAQAEGFADQFQRAAKRITR